MGVFRQLGISLSTESSGKGKFPSHRPSRLHSNRNETVDATHLCEFHQVEGVIADYGLTLGGLMEFMEIFFNAMGVTDLRFKPA